MTKPVAIFLGTTPPPDEPNSSYRGYGSIQKLEHIPVGTELFAKPSNETVISDYIREHMIMYYTGRLSVENNTDSVLNDLINEVLAREEYANKKGLYK